jgi:hypothetical protein
MGGDDVQRERRIDVPILDLDQVAAIVADRRARWATAHGLVADPVTWVDADAQWPRPLLTDWSQVASPMSVGVRVHGDECEAEIVVYAGGWADADYARLGVDDAAISEYVELDDADAVQALLDRVIGHLSRPGANDG